MVMTVDDQGLRVGLMWENQSWGLTNSDNSGDQSKENMKRTNQKEGNEGEALIVNKKRSRGSGSRSDKKNVTNGEEGKCRESDHELHIWTERERRKKMRNMFASLHDLLPQLPSKADKSTIVDEAVNYIKKLEQTLEKLEKQKQEKLQFVSPIGCESSVINSQWHHYDSREAFIADHQGSSSNNNLSTAMVTTNPSKPPVAFQTWSSPNLVLNIIGDEAQFCICATKKQGLLTTIAFVLEKHQIDVISANILCKGTGNVYMILAHDNYQEVKSFVTCSYLIASPNAKGASYQFQDANSMWETYRNAAKEILIWIR